MAPGFPPTGSPGPRRGRPQLRIVDAEPSRRRDAAVEEAQLLLAGTPVAPGRRSAHTGSAVAIRVEPVPGDRVIVGIAPSEGPQGLFAGYQVALTPLEGGRPGIAGAVATVDQWGTAAFPALERAEHRAVLLSGTAAKGGSELDLALPAAIAVADEIQVRLGALDRRLGISLSSQGRPRDGIAWLRYRTGRHRGRMIVVPCFGSTPPPAGPPAPEGRVGLRGIGCLASGDLDDEAWADRIAQSARQSGRAWAEAWRRILERDDLRPSARRAIAAALEAT